MTPNQQATHTAPPRTGDGVAKFHDLCGRPWKLLVTVATVQRIKQDHGIDLLRILDRTDNPLLKLADDPVQLCDVLWSLIAGQAQEAGVDRLAWLEAMGGDSMTEAAYALMEATCDFFPQHRRGPLRTMLAKMRAAEQTLTARVQSLADSMTMDQAIAREIDRTAKQAETNLVAELQRLGS